MKLPKHYQSVVRVIRRHWQNYGGNEAVFLSPYLHVAILFGTLFFPYGENGEGFWWDLPIEILPSLIGFSLGGYAIFLAFGDEKFKKVMSATKEENEPSAYLSFSAAFVHFMIVQIIGLLLAIIAKNLGLEPTFPFTQNILSNILPYGIGIISFTVFAYAIFLALAAVFSMYRMVFLYDEYLRILPDDD